MIETQAEIWRRLIQGKNLEGLEIGTIDGRLDLRHLHIAEPRVVRTIPTPIVDVIELDGVTIIKGVSWHSLDFSSAQLAGLKLIDCNISDCIFDGCRLPQFGAWCTSFTNVSFRSAYLRDAVLGGTSEDIGWNIFRWNKSNRNIFANVDFTLADLRGTAYRAAGFEGCKFKNTKLNKVLFNNCTFADCSFEGELREVCFYDRGFRGEKFPENKMTRVDFRQASIRLPEFRCLDLDDVYFPENDEHILVENYPEVLERLYNFFDSKPDNGSQGLAGLLEFEKKWIGKNRKVGIFNKLDILETAGEEGLQLFMQIVGSDLRRSGPRNR